jgi:hypothetical protein
VELLVGFMLLSIVWVMVSNVFMSQVKAVETITREMDAETSVRHTMIVLEKQIQSSDRIVVQSGRVYLQDLETSMYMNYYTLEGIYLYKNKVREDLTSIGLGAKSQMAYNIFGFQLNLHSSGGVEVKLESRVEDQVYAMSKIIQPTCPVYVFE